MKEIFAWAPWFRELAVKIAEGGEECLIRKARLVDWDKEPELLKHGDQGVDPFSFLYSLAQRNTTNQRPKIYPSVTKCFGLESPLADLGDEDFYIFPTPPPHGAACFHDSSDFSPKLLWKLFRQVVEHEPQVDPTTFREVLKIKFVAPVKLTHTLCLINPDYFVPADALQHVPANKGMDPKDCDHDGYMAAMDKAKQTFRECRAYEINTFLYLPVHVEIPAPDHRIPVLPSQHEGIRGRLLGRFRPEPQPCTRTHADRRGADWRRGTTRSNSRRRTSPAPYPLTEPKRGDVILVRTGFRRGRAIGVVHGNDYAET